MRRRSPTRRVLKWVGLVGCVVLTAAWGITLFCTFGYMGSSTAAWFQYDGAVVVAYYAQTAEVRPGWFAFDDRPPDPDQLWLPRRVAGAGRDYFAIPVWMPILLLALPTATLWYRDRRPPKGHCQNCGYNLTGNVSGRCPECGEPT
jgi:hypothetical protein